MLNRASGSIQGFGPWRRLALKALATGTSTRANATPLHCRGAPMQIAVDISLYPLNANYIPPIKDFIERIGLHEGLTIEYNSLSTQVRGELDAVFAALQAEIAATYRGPDRAVFVLKLVGGTEPRRARPAPAPRSRG
jgi:uncharacterized protein YqgV (UPF0045/DUF77 family)